MSGGSCKSKDYGAVAYWDARYSSRSSAGGDGGVFFDWYQTYPALRPLLRARVPGSSRVLMLGCGNSPIVATKAMLSDPRAEPRYGERVSYVVIHGEPGAHLVDMVIDPYDIPALQRVFGLLGADLNKWFNEMPRPIRLTLAKRQSASGHGSCSRDGSFILLGLNKKASTKGSRIDTYYMSSHCSICGDIIQGSDTFCNNCLKSEAVVATVVAGRTSKPEREIQHLAAICGHCGGADWVVESGVKCISLACPVFYERRKIQKELRVV